MAVPVRLRSKVQKRIGRNIWVLIFWILLACLYVGWMGYFGQFTESTRLDGSIGMLLGLYISSHPAGNMLDMLLFMTADVREGIISTRSGQFWLVLNAVTLLAGWAAIFSGALRFVQPS
jgi:putative copper export protein